MKEQYFFQAQTFGKKHDGKSVTNLIQKPYKGSKKHILKVEGK